tara:strand:+ start:4656 stop:5042 length:387 start_codon:yes stop_codon:yes gene_type:complete
MNTIVDSTKLKKKIPYYQIVDIENEIDNVPVTPQTGKENWTRDAEILVYDSSESKPKSPLSIVLALMYKESNKYYRKAEKTTAKLLGRSSDKDLVKIYRRSQMSMFWYSLDMMMYEVQNTMMHIALNK